MIQQSQRIMIDLAGIDHADDTPVGLVSDTDDASSSIAESAAPMSDMGEGTSSGGGRGVKAPTPQVVVAAELGELLLFVSGRTADEWWPEEEVRVLWVCVWVWV